MLSQGPGNGNDVAELQGEAEEIRQPHDTHSHRPGEMLEQIAERIEIIGFPHTQNFIPSRLE